MLKNLSVNIKVFLTLIFVCSAGIPFFEGDIIFLTCFLIVSLLFVASNLHYDKEFIYFILLVSLVLLVQCVTYGGGYVTAVGTLMRMMAAYWFVKLVGKRIVSDYVNVIFTLTCLSLIVHLLFILNLGIYEKMVDFHLRYILPFELLPDLVRYHVFIYTFDEWLFELYPRNAGAFWEPGANGVFLVLALYFNLSQTRKHLTFKNLVFTLALFSTFSLAAYFTFSVLIVSYLFSLERSKVFKIAFLTILFTGGIFVYRSMPFLGEKYEYRFVKYESKKEKNLEDLTKKPDRFMATALDIVETRKSPFIGNKILPNKFLRSTNSVTALFREYGVIVGGVFFYFLYQSSKCLNMQTGCKTFHNSSFFLIFLVNSLTQALFGKVLFLSLFFLYFSLRDKSSLHV